VKLGLPFPRPVSKNIVEEPIDEGIYHYIAVTVKNGNL